MNRAETENDAVPLAAPILGVPRISPNPPPEPRDPTLRREHTAFMHLLPELLKPHHGQFVAVHDGQVIESGSDKIAVIRKAHARFGYRPIYVHLVTDEPQALERIPSLGRSHAEVTS
jgi:hypothetical protein